MAEKAKNDLDNRASAGEINCNNIEAGEFPSVQSLIKKFDGLSGRKSPKSFPLVSKQREPVESVAASPKATSPTEVSFDEKATIDCGSDVSVSGDLETSTNEADLALIKSENLPNDGGEFPIKNEEEVASNVTSAAAAEPRQDCLEAGHCTDDEAALEEALSSPSLECDEQRVKDVTVATTAETIKANAKSEEEVTETVSAEEAVEYEELAIAEARDDSENSNEQVAPPDACADSTGDCGDTDLFVEAMEVLNDLEEGIAAPEIAEDTSIFASAPAPASGSESSSSLMSTSASPTAAVACSSSEEAPALPQKITVRVVSGTRKQPKKLRYRRSCPSIGILASSDSMTSVSPKKRRPLLSNCARTLKNKVLDASRTMMSLVSLRTEESAPSGRSKHHGVSASAPASLSPSSVVPPSPVTTTGTAVTLQSPPVLRSEEEPLLDVESAEHQENNSARNNSPSTDSPGLTCSIRSSNKQNSETTRWQHERLQPAILSLQVTDAASAARMSFTFVSKRHNSTPANTNFSQSGRYFGSFETAAFFAFDELDADVSLEVAEIPTATAVSVSGRPLFSRLVRQYEVN